MEMQEIIENNINNYWKELRENRSLRNTERLCLEELFQANVRIAEHYDYPVEAFRLMFEEYKTFKYRSNVHVLQGTLFEREECNGGHRYEKRD